MSPELTVYDDAGLSSPLGPICKFFVPFPAAATQGTLLPCHPLSVSLVTVALPSPAVVGGPRHSSVDGTQKVASAVDMQSLYQMAQGFQKESCHHPSPFSSFVPVVVFEVFSKCVVQYANHLF